MNEGASPFEHTGRRRIQQLVRWSFHQGNHQRGRAPGREAPVSPNDPTVPKRRRGRQWVTDRITVSESSFDDDIRVCLSPFSFTGISFVHDQAPFTTGVGNATAERRKNKRSVLLPRKRNGDEGQGREKRSAARGIPKNQRSADHSLAGNPPETGRAEEQKPGWNTGTRTVPGRQQINGAGAEMPSAAGPPCKRRTGDLVCPRFLFRRNRRKTDGFGGAGTPPQRASGEARWIPRLHSNALAAAEMPSARKKGEKRNELS